MNIGLFLIGVATSIISITTFDLTLSAPQFLQAERMASGVIASSNSNLKGLPASMLELANRAHIYDFRAAIIFLIIISIIGLVASVLLKNSVTRIDLMKD